MRFILSSLWKWRFPKPVNLEKELREINMMFGKTFDLCPSVDLLQVLARGSLRQNLPKAVRVWVLLRSLYGDESDPMRLDLGGNFTYSEWNKLFFNLTNHEHKDYKIPTDHDPNCPCAKTISDWLFDSNMGCEATTWQHSFLQLYSMSQSELDSLLLSGIINKNGENSNKQTPLPGGRLFAITSKNIQYDFGALVEMGWLKIQKITSCNSKRCKTLYCRVEDFPNLGIYPNPPIAQSEIKVSNVIQNDLADFFNDFGGEINGKQRFFLDIEYIVPANFSEQINTIRQQLKEVWQQSIVPPIKITYISARNYQSYQDEGEEYIVYPVCIYYSHRAPYLFSFGQDPVNKGKIGWYDYRLDRIQKLEQLTWDQVKIADFSEQICH